ncbi:hypothetical protein HMPREF2978_00645 [Corynebacterium sp. HMSC074C01]|uniref:hypothetical protein n=1 Tax=Corynebacterium sp. HMSC074C01 TaxID=1739482 RepID=UPI0008A2A119|nr:hypothetical protein [Corynebacterium sp. HMSC074C01]OFP63523.1 hypothetical protein HMPREF2978_00645 [Corynebacterium sp. HMSC074C01]
MRNFDQALKVLEAARRPGELRIHPNDAVEALADAGLLAEDLPEPSRGMGSGGAVWYLPGPVGDIRSYGEHIVVFGHDCQEKPFRLVLNAPEAVAIGRTILAAAKHEEGKA